MLTGGNTENLESVKPWIQTWVDCRVVWLSFLDENRRHFEHKKQSTKDNMNHCNSQSTLGNMGNIDIYVFLEVRETHGCDNSIRGKYSKGLGTNLKIKRHNNRRMKEKWDKWKITDVKRSRHLEDQIDYKTYIDLALPMYLRPLGTYSYHQCYYYRKALGPCWLAVPEAQR